MITYLVGLFATLVATVIMYLIGKAYAILSKDPDINGITCVVAGLVICGIIFMLSTIPYLVGLFILNH